MAPHSSHEHVLGDERRTGRPCADPFVGAPLDEDAAKRLPAKDIATEKRKVCEAVLDLMVREDQFSRSLAWTFQRGLLPQEQWTWEPADSRSKLKREYERLKKWLAPK